MRKVMLLGAVVLAASPEVAGALLSLLCGVASAVVPFWAELLGSTNKAGSPAAKAGRAPALKATASAEVPNRRNQAGRNGGVAVVIGIGSSTSAGL